MRTLWRNKETLWFSNPTGETQVKDDNGFLTGESRIEYGKPKRLRMSVSIYPGASTLGEDSRVTLEQFGILQSCTHRAITDDMNCPIGIASLIWYGRDPTETIDGKTVDVPHNFKVIRKAPSKNHMVYYLKEVDVR